MSDQSALQRGKQPPLSLQKRTVWWWFGWGGGPSCALLSCDWSEHTPEHAKWHAQIELSSKSYMTEGVSEWWRFSLEIGNVLGKGKRHNATGHGNHESVRSHEGCGGLREESPGAFPNSGPIFQEHLSFPVNSLSLAGIAFRISRNLWGFSQTLEVFLETFPEPNLGQPLPSESQVFWKLKTLICDHIWAWVGLEELCD